MNELSRPLRSPLKIIRKALKKRTLRPQGINRDGFADSGKMGRKGSNKKLNSSVIDRESMDVEARVPIAVSNSVVSLKDTWSYSKPPKPRQFGETTTPTKKKQSLPTNQWKRQIKHRKYKPSKANLHINQHQCICRICKDQPLIPLQHKEKCREQLRCAKERDGTRAERLLFSSLCEYTPCKRDSLKIRAHYFLPPPTDLVAKIRVCKLTFVNVFGLARNTKKLAKLRLSDKSAILPAEQLRGKHRLGWSQLARVEMKNHLKRYPRTSGMNWCVHHFFARN